MTLGDLFGAPEQVAELYHLKYSKAAKAGGRIDDMPGICGQAQTSIGWRSSGEKRSDLFTRLLRREETCQLPFTAVINS